MEVCEVCEGLPHGAPSASVAPKAFSHLLIGDRLFSLCSFHAEFVRSEEPASVEELRRLFPEKDGKRSIVARRAPFDRRVFPARPEGRRRGQGRRLGDPVG